MNPSIERHYSSDTGPTDTFLFSFAAPVILHVELPDHRSRRISQDRTGPRAPFCHERLVYAPLPPTTRLLSLSNIIKADLCLPVSVSLAVVIPSLILAFNLGKFARWQPITGLNEQLGHPRSWIERMKRRSALNTTNEGGVEAKGPENPMEDSERWWSVRQIGRRVLERDERRGTDEERGGRSLPVLAR
jgi:hypothetical protein